MDGEAWKAAVHGVAEGRTGLSDFTFTFHFHALEKEMATHSSALVWRIPGTGEPGGLPSMGSHGVGHDWSDLAAAAAAADVAEDNSGLEDATIETIQSFHLFSWKIFLKIHLDIVEVKTTTCEIKNTRLYCNRRLD